MPAFLPWGGALRLVGSALLAQHEWLGSLRCKMGRKLDLSKLTDEEAKHVWEVVQRDFDLRKKEEERLEDLKCKIDQESSKREFLTHQSHLNETHCVHCLQPFKFLLNSKRQCLDCHFYTCKSCSRYNKREQGWVCDPCRLSRVVKIGSLEWYYEHVRSRFKRFGSAKVLQSLYGRLQPEQKGNSALLGLHDRVYSLPDINSECQLPTNGGIVDDSDDEDDALRGAEAECYSRSFPDFPSPAEDAPREPRLEEADLAAVFRILREQEQHLSPPEQHFSTEVRLTLNARRRSLDRSSKPGSPWIEQPRSPYSADMDTSDEDVKGAPKLTACLPHHLKCRSRASSQENVSHNSGSQSPATESQLDPDAEEEELKKKLEEFTSNISDREVSSEEEECEERKGVKRPEMSSSGDDMASEARKRSSAQALSEITAKALRAINATEKVVSESLQGQSWGSGGRALPRGQHLSMEDGKEAAEAYRELEENVYLAAGKAYQLETTLTELEEGARHGSTTNSELLELEDKVASAAAQVQQAESEVRAYPYRELLHPQPSKQSWLGVLQTLPACLVFLPLKISDIESRIAALSAAGLTVKPVEKARKKSSGQAFHLCSPNPTSSSPGESLDDVKAISGPQVLRRRFNSPIEITGFDDSFDRNSVYRGSLTQRNPNGKNRRVERLFAKPVMTHLP
ncbi:melanophilin isoform X8 [Numida meleagris]|uniref:melanophilin isoform X8 n=1 Tax=Numida meleagris TaxID=8996 RepID=UPI000B3DB412|nr:melanophilin isoform X8 [Numida meleagris]